MAGYSSASWAIGVPCNDRITTDTPPPFTSPNTTFGYTPLQLRAVVIAGASDHTWLDPGARLDHALLACQAFLNLYNKRDEALRLYPFLRRSDHHQALGKVGLTKKDLARLGPLAARYDEHDMDDQLGQEHTLLDAVANPEIAKLIAPYVWNFNPSPPPHQQASETLQERLGREMGLTWLRGFFRRGPLGRSAN